LLKDVFKLDKATIDTVVEPETIDNAALLIIVGGAIVMVLGFIGCFGAWRESQCLLVTFFFILFLILGLVVAGVILFAFFPTHIENNFKAEFKKVFDKWVDDGNTNQTVDFIQESLKCCGIDGQQDYTSQNKTVPNSCKEGNVSSGTIYTTGCLDAFKAKINELITSKSWIIGGIGIGVLVLLIGGMVLSCCLFCAVRKADKDY